MNMRLLIIAGCAFLKARHKHVAVKRAAEIIRVHCALEREANPGHDPLRARSESKREKRR